MSKQRKCEPFPQVKRRRDARLTCDIKDKSWRSAYHEQSKLTSETCGVTAINSEFRNLSRIFVVSRDCCPVQ
eukprot:1518785-Amphidinium_carterae.1